MYRNLIQNSVVEQISCFFGVFFNPWIVNLPKVNFEYALIQSNNLLEAMIQSNNIIGSYDPV